MIVPRFVIGFSGHRHLKDPELVRVALQGVWRGLQQQIANAGLIEVYSSIAYGADTLAVETARAAELPVHLILPKPVKFSSGLIDSNEGFALDFWEPGSDGQTPRFRAEDWERASKQILSARLGTNGGTLRVVRDCQSDPECYYHAGLQVLEACDILVAVWDGKEARGVGGTAQIVAHAKRCGVPVIVIDPETGRIPEKRQSDKFDPKMAAGIEVIEEVRHFARSYADQGACNGESSGEIFSCLEECSNRASKHFRNHAVRIIKLHGGATFVAAIACIIPHSSPVWKALLAVLALAEFCMVGWAWYQMWRLNKHQVHERWIKSRFAAELIRSLRCTTGFLDPLHPLVARHDGGWRRFTTALGLMLHREQPKGEWKEERNRYLADRLRSPELRFGQIQFFKERQTFAQRHSRQMAKWAQTFTQAAAILVFFAVIYKTWSWLGNDSHAPAVASAPGEWPLKDAAADVLFRLLPIVLPLAAGVFVSLRGTLDSGRRSDRYKELAQFLETSATRLEVLQTESSVCRTIEGIEEVLLDELVEWRLAEKQNHVH